MTLYVGTIQEITGKGLEILVDFESKSRVLARFIDGQMVPELTVSRETSEASVVLSHMTLQEDDRTIIAKAS